MSLTISDTDQLVFNVAVVAAVAVVVVVVAVVNWIAILVPQMLRSIIVKSQTRKKMFVKKFLLEV